MMEIRVEHDNLASLHILCTLGVCFFGETSENELAEGTMKSTIDIAFGDLIEIHNMNNDELSKCLE